MYTFFDKYIIHYYLCKSEKSMKSVCQERYTFPDRRKSIIIRILLFVNDISEIRLA